MRPAHPIDRRAFLGSAAALTTLARAGAPQKKTRIGLIGCGSVSGVYLPNLTKCPDAQVVSVCDRIPERAQRAAEKFGVAHHYPSIETMLVGEPFDLLVNLTDMQEHEHLNRQAIAAGKHVWSEKPIANSHAAGVELLEQSKAKGLRLWGAPAVVTSPQFAFMSRTLREGKLGKVAAAHATYGHLGPDWSAFFYEQGGGSLPDLGVYNLTTLTGLLGPARAVMAMTGIITPTRKTTNKGEIRVEAEDNASVLLDHGDGAFSHVSCGFNFFDPGGHDGGGAPKATISLVGTHGSMQLIGYDWAPRAVDLATRDHPEPQRLCDDTAGWVWEQGAAMAARTLATGEEILIRPEHALHVVDIMKAAVQSQATGRRIELSSTFPWPIQA